MKRFLNLATALCLFMIAGLAHAQANIEVDTPAINALKKGMQARFAGLSPYLESGAVGLTRDGMVALRDANAVPLPKRAEANALVADENKDRAALYREIARANGKPEWENDIKSTFGERWISRASAGWYYQSAQGQWVKK
jgi:uncharacterized protein YdbL (DUF1318 family)